MYPAVIKIHRFTDNASLYGAISQDFVNEHLVVKSFGLRQPQATFYIPIYKCKLKIAKYLFSLRLLDMRAIVQL